ncbi:MAG: magnesium transporter [Bdellovibrionales bacterium]
MLKKPTFSLKKKLDAPHVGSPEFLDLNSTELGQWIVLSSAEDFTNGLDALKSHPQFEDSLKDLPEATLKEVLKRLNEDELINILNQTDLDDTTYFLETLGEEFTETIVPKLKRQRKLKQYLNYPKDSCGRSMQTEFFTLPIDITAKEALKLIQEKAGESPIYYLYCLTTTNKLIGVVSLRQLATSANQTPLDDLVNREVLSVTTTEDITEAIEIVKRENFVALPVVDETKRISGIILVDDLIDEMEDQATADIYAQAGLQQMDSVTMKARLSYLNRVPWLLFNLLLAWVASFVISFFEATLAEFTLLAILMPISAALGGNTAVQTLTIVTRGLATGDFNYITYSKAILKEISVGVSLGITTGFTAALMVYLWKGTYVIGAVLGISMIINSFVAATLGASIPIILKNLGKDPAVSSGVFVITITDIFSFFSFLSLATIGLKMFGY